jgi:Ca2+-binding EF-hand superfamily protein
MLIAQYLVTHKKHALLALCMFFCLAEPALTAPRDGQNNRENQTNTDETIAESIDSDSQEGAPQQALDSNISIEERMRLHRDLEEYSRTVDPAHVQIEERRRVMRMRLQQRFVGSDKDNDGSISREEAFETMPQIARHFSQVDLNNDGVITLNELEAAQARAIEHQRAATAKAEEAQETEPAKRKNKDLASNRKRAL